MPRAASTSAADRSAASAPLTIAPGEGRDIAIAGHGLRIQVDSESSVGLCLSRSFFPFLISGGAVELKMRASSASRLERASGSLIFDSGLHWRALQAQSGTIFEFVHPPTGLLYCQARLDRSFSRSEVFFSESAPRDPASSGWQLPYPLDQLLLVPALAMRGTVLFHACGAVVAGSGLVFAGHSGEGKTTLGGILQSEGTKLLSDERVAVRLTERGFLAYGTPWPGEGDIVSNAHRPLGAMFLLKKAARHALGPPSPGLSPELVARAIVPYYLPEVAERVFGVLGELASAVPFRELQFARAPGLTALLRESAPKA